MNWVLLKDDSFRRVAITIVVITVQLCSPILAVTVVYFLFSCTTGKRRFQSLYSAGFFFLYPWIFSTSNPLSLGGNKWCNSDVKFFWLPPEKENTVPGKIYRPQHHLLPPKTARNCVNIQLVSEKKNHLHWLFFFQTPILLFIKKQARAKLFVWSGLK